MRGTRALVGAFGAGMSLAIAGSLALLVVSSVIAFKGWPDDLSGRAEPEIARLSADPGAASSAAAATHVVALPAARTVTASTRGRRGTLGRRVVSVADGTGASAVATTGAPSAAPAASPPSSAGAGTPSTARPRPSLKTDVPVQRVTDAVRDTTKAVGDTVAPVSPAVGGALESVGAAGADAVDKVAGSVLP